MVLCSPQKTDAHPSTWRGGGTELPPAIYMCSQAVEVSKAHKAHLLVMSLFFWSGVTCSPSTLPVSDICFLLLSTPKKESQRYI